MMTYADLLRQVVSSDDEMIRAATAELRHIAEDNPALAPAAIDTLSHVLAVPRDKFDLREDLLLEEDFSLGSVNTRIPRAKASALPGGDPFDVPDDFYASSAFMDDHGIADHREIALWQLFQLASVYPEATETAVEPIVALTDDDHSMTREYALLAVSRITTLGDTSSDRVVREVLVPALRSGQTGKQAVAAWGVADIATADPDAAMQARQRLIPLLTGEEWYLRANAAEALSLLAAANPEAVGDSDFDIEEAIASDNYAEVCTWILTRASASSTCDIASNATLVEFQESTDRTMEPVLEGHGILDAVTDALVEISQSAEPRIRQAATVGLVYLGPSTMSDDGAVMPRLIELTDDEHSEVAALASDLLQTWPQKPQWPTEATQIDPQANALDLEVYSRPESTHLGNYARVDATWDDTRFRYYPDERRWIAVARVTGPDGTSLVKLSRESPPEDESVEVHPAIEAHLGVSDGEHVTVEPANLQFAYSVTVRVPDTLRRLWDGCVEHEIKKHIRTAMVVAPGDVVPICGSVEQNEGDESQPLSLSARIESVRPSNPAFLTADSVVRVRFDDALEIQGCENVSTCTDLTTYCSGDPLIYGYSPRGPPALQDFPIDHADATVRCGDPFDNHPD